MKWILLAALLAPQDTAREREIENKIASVKMTVDFKNTTLKDVMSYIREIADINIVIDVIRYFNGDIYLDHLVIRWPEDSGVHRYREFGRYGVRLIRDCDRLSRGRGVTTRIGCRPSDDGYTEWE